MISTVILVHAEFDIARGCKTLRSHVATQNWKPIIGARAAAAFTAIGDLILNSDSNELVPINITLRNDTKLKSIEFVCHFYSASRENAAMLQARQRLERATDELDIYETAGNVQVTARLYIS